MSRLKVFSVDLVDIFLFCAYLCVPAQTAMLSLANTPARTVLNRVGLCSELKVPAALSLQCLKANHRYTTLIAICYAFQPCNLREFSLFSSVKTSDHQLSANQQQQMYQQDMNPTYYSFITKFFDSGSLLIQYESDNLKVGDLLEMPFGIGMFHWGIYLGFFAGDHQMASAHEGTIVDLYSAGEAMAHPSIGDWSKTKTADWIVKAAVCLHKFILEEHTNYDPRRLADDGMKTTGFGARCSQSTAEYLMSVQHQKQEKRQS
uniref:LRAT domain-containing protein n=1 Tax=Ditylenchus dipsaci TaxID=166011 RepID=A0A915DN58_9BILA